MHNLVLNTPSTHGTEKKFHSLEMQRRQAEPSTCRPHGHISLTKTREHQASTKILTLSEIKSHSLHSSQQPETGNGLRRDKSRGIFVSISKRNSSSKEKREPFLS
jgi:hypothetical protein